LTRLRRISLSVPVPRHKVRDRPPLAPVDAYRPSSFPDPGKYSSRTERGEWEWTHHGDNTGTPELDGHFCGMGKGTVRGEQST
jgi:hypothetical protein